MYKYLNPSFARNVCFIVLSVFVLSSCADEKYKASMKSLNKGVKAAQGKEYFQAGEHFKRSVADYRDNHNAWFMWGEIETKQAIKSKKKEMWLSAAEKYKEAVKRQGNPGVFDEIGHGSIRSGAERRGGTKFPQGAGKVA